MSPGGCDSPRCGGAKAAREGLAIAAGIIRTIRGNLFCRSELHPKASEEQTTRKPVFIKDDKKLPASQADGQSHKPAKHIEETARLASSIEATKERCDELKIKCGAYIS